MPGSCASLWWRLLAWLPGLGYLLVVLAPPLNHDVAAVLAFAQRWLAGEGLYTDLIDINPPLIFLLSLPAAWIGAHTPVCAVAALLAGILALCAGACLLALRLARGAAEAPLEAAALAVVLPLVTLAAGYDFGQREHLMLVAALPYLFLAARRLEGLPTGRAASLGAATLAAAGFALKPHFLAVPALVELYLLLRRGPRRALWDPVPWLMAALWLGYLGLIALDFPAYPAGILPLAWDSYLDLDGFTWWQALLTERLGTAVLLLVPLGLLACRAGDAALPRVLALAGAGAALAAVVQHKGWTYHAMPVRLLGGLLAVVLVARWLEGALPPARLRRMAPGFAALAAGAIGLHNLAGAEAPWREITWSWSRAGQLAALLGREVPGRPVLVLSPDIFPVHPALNYAGVRSTLPTMNLWLLQGAYRDCAAGSGRYHPRAAMPAGEALLFRRVTRDFVARPPAAILLSRHPNIPHCDGEFDVLAYFSRDPLFAEALRRYRPAAELEGYQLLRREE